MLTLQAPEGEGAEGLASACCTPQEEFALDLCPVSLTSVSIAYLWSSRTRQHGFLLFQLRPGKQGGFSHGDPISSFSSCQVGAEQDPGWTGPLTPAACRNTLREAEPRVSADRRTMRVAAQSPAICPLEHGVLAFQQGSLQSCLPVKPAAGGRPPPWDPSSQGSCPQQRQSPWPSSSKATASHWPVDSPGAAQCHSRATLKPESPVAPGCWGPAVDRK